MRAAKHRYRSSVPCFRIPICVLTAEAVAEIAKLRVREDYEARMIAENQRLSRDLAHCYHRDVFADARLAPGQWAVLWRDRPTQRTLGIPTNRFLVRSPFKAVAVAPDVARALLERDKGP